MKRSGWIGFNIHDVATVGVARAAPTASLFEDMFAPFRADGLDRFDLRISSQYEPWRGGVFGEIDGEAKFHYTEDALCLNAPRVQVMRDGDGFRLNGASELLEHALPLLDRILVTRGVAMIHALTVDYRGHGLCMPAWSGTGKTSTMAKLVKMAGFSFMGDDWGFLTRDGVLLGCARPMFIRPHHRPMYPHLFQWPHKPLVPVRVSKHLARLTRLAHRYVSRYPQVAYVTRQWSPEHMMVMPREALPGARVSTAARLAASLFVERFESRDASPQFIAETRDSMVSRLVSGFHAGLPKASRVMLAVLDASGMVPIQRSLAEKAAVVRAALDGKPAFLLRVPRSLAPDQASDVISEHVRRALDSAGVT